MVAGPEVKNFNQLKVGDKVDIQYVEALVLELKKVAAYRWRVPRRTTW